MENSDISKAFNGFVNMLKDFGDAAKLYSLIKAEEAKKQEQYYKLGKKYYSLFKDCPEKDLRPIVDKLIASDEKIARLKAELSDTDSDYRDVEEDAGDSKEAGPVKETGADKGAEAGDCGQEKAEEIRESAEEAADKVLNSAAEAVNETRESAEELRRTLSEDLDSGEPKQE